MAMADGEQAEAKYRRLIDNLTVGVFESTVDGRFVRLNRRVAEMAGYASVAEMMAVPADSLYMDPEDRERLTDVLRRQGEAKGFEFRSRRKDGTEFWISMRAILMRDPAGGPELIMGIADDISEEKFREAEREIASRLIESINSPDDFRLCLRKLVSSLQAWSGCQAVGIRLRDGDDFPYYESRGFSPEFVELERTLCAYGPDGKIQRDGRGDPVLECMCGNVLCGRFDPAKPFFTARGSFWSNDTTRLLAATSDADRQARTRNRCNGEGYESVALVALRFGAETIGLLQFNDRRKDRFTADLLARFEGIADGLATAIAHRRANEALRESEARYRTLADSGQALIWTSGPDKKCDYFNLPWLEFTGRRLEEELGDGWAEGVHPEDLERCVETYANAFDRRETFAMDYRLRHRGGDYRWIQDTGSPRYDSKGEFLGYIGHCLDITGLKRLESELAVSEAKFSSAFYANPQLMTIRDLSSGLLTEVNDAFAEATGYSREELVGETSQGLGIISGEDGRALRALMERHGGAIPGADVRLHKKDGGAMWVDYHGQILDLGGKKVLLSTAQDITERRRIEEALRNSEATLNEAMEIARLGAWSLDIASETFTFTDHFYALLGTTADREGGYRMPAARYSQTYIYPEDREPAAAAALKAMESAERDHHAQFDHRILRADGRIGYVSVHIRVVKDAEGNLVRTFGVSQDITERRMADEALRAGEARLSEAMRIAKLGAWTLDLATNTFTFDDQLYSILGTKAEREGGYSMDRDLYSKRFIHPDDRSMVVNEISKLLRAEDPGHFSSVDHRIIRDDGSMGYVSVHLRVVKDENGQATATFGVNQDITERKLGELELAAEKERLNVTLRSIGDGVITTDTRGRVDLMNQVAEELCGWTQDQARGRPLPEVFRIVNEFSREACENPAQKALSSGQIIELANHTVLVSRNGSERAIADSGSPIKDAEGSIIGVVLVFRDVTQKQKLLETIQRTDKLDSLGILAGGIAHDFNNLLGGIFGYISMAQGRLPAESQPAALLDKALSVFNRAKDLTQQLLTFSSGGAPMRKTGQLGPLIRDTAGFALSGSNIACEFGIAEDLWPCDFDAGQISQVIDNIVINARQAMPLGGGIRISAKNAEGEPGATMAARAGRHVLVSIADSGTGIPRNLLKRIFDPFFTTKEKGHGLGLATCYSIVQKHGGSIEADSEPGVGTTFRIYLPASRGAADGTAPARASGHSGIGTFLVMDDEDFMREIAAEMLKGMGYGVIEAKDGEEALSACARAAKEGEPVGAAILDLTIPGGMGGKETVAALMAAYPSMIAIASSGFSQDPVMADPTAYGFAGSIQKPYKTADLAALLTRLAGRA